MSLDIEALNKLTIKPVYDIAVGQKSLFYPFTVMRASQVLTGGYAASTILGNTETLDSITSYEITSDWPEIVQKQDTIQGYSWGDDTDLEVIFFMRPRYSFEIVNCFIQAAFAMNISAYTDNGVTFDSVDFEVRKYHGNNTTNYDQVLRKNFVTGHNQREATGADIFLLQTSFQSESVDPSDTLGLYFKCNNTKVITSTYQSLMLPWFSWTETDNTKSFYQSGVMSHELPSFDAAALPFKHELQNWPIDIFGAQVR